MNEQQAKRSAWPTQAFIAGQWLSASDGQHFAVHDPATDRRLADVADCGAAEARLAIDAAVQAFPAWAQKPAEERAQVVRRLGELIEHHADLLADVMVAEQGKPRREALAEISSSSASFLWAAEEVRRIYGETVPASAGKRIIVLRQPVGVSVAITPWNFPLGMIARKLAPALACGCPQLIKPAAQTPLSALMLARLVQEAGVPDGLVAVVPTTRPGEVVETWLADERVRKLSFTGSTAVGKSLWRSAATHLQRVSLELGGHAPALVLDDADLEVAVSQILRSKFRNAGQTCICVNRVFVHHSLHDALVEKLTKAARSLRVGPGDAPETQIGPLIDDNAMAKVKRHVHDATTHGAKITCGGHVVELPGLSQRFFAPTVLTEVNDKMVVMHEETFGPILPIVRVATNREAVERANALPVGLAAYLFGQDYRKVTQAAEALEFGIVGINDGGPTTVQAPFGGWKSSGVGREGGHWVMDSYLEIKYVSLGGFDGDALAH